MNLRSLDLSNIGQSHEKRNTELKLKENEFVKSRNKNSKTINGYRVAASDRSTGNNTKENGTLCSQFRNEIAKGKIVIKKELIESKQRIDRYKQNNETETVQNTIEKSPTKKLNSEFIKVNSQPTFKTEVDKEKLPMIKHKTMSNVVNIMSNKISNLSLKKQSTIKQDPRDDDIKVSNFLLHKHNNGYSRKKTFEVEFIPNWHAKNNLLPSKLNPTLSSNIEFQSSIIMDEIKVLMDSILHYRSKCLNDRILLNIFRHLSLKKKVKMNKLLEETCGLILKIANGILLDFSKFLEKFVSIQPPSPEKLQTRIIKDEEIAFKDNCNLLVEISIFLKSCFEVYSTLTRQVDDMTLSHKALLVILQFMERSRMNMSSLIYSTKNYKDNYVRDISIYYKYKMQMCRLYNNLEEEEKMEKEEEYCYYKENKGVKKFSKIYEDNERKRRLNRVLFKKNLTEEQEVLEIRKRELGRQFNKNKGLNSSIIDKILKYCPSDIKSEILSFRMMIIMKEQEDSKKEKE